MSGFGTEWDRTGSSGVGVVLLSVGLAVCLGSGMWEQQWAGLACQS